MDILNRFWRFTQKDKHVLNSDKIKQEIKKYASECLNNPSGEVLIKHLIEEFRLDGQIGCVDQNEAMYELGKRDALIYILSLIEPE